MRLAPFFIFIIPAFPSVNTEYLSEPCVNFLISLCALAPWCEIFTVIILNLINIDISMQLSKPIFRFHQ